MTVERLYGSPGAERLWDDPATVYEEHEDVWIPGATYSIEEWSVRPQRDFLPSADSVIERLVEGVEEVDEDGADAWTNASLKPEVVAAFEAALDLLCSKVSYVMAEKLLTVHDLTFDPEGKPLLDGEPLYVKVQEAPQ